MSRNKYKPYCMVTRKSCYETELQYRNRMKEKYDKYHKDIEKIEKINVNNLKDHFTKKYIRKCPYIPIEFYFTYPDYIDYDHIHYNIFINEEFIIKHINNLGLSDIIYLNESLDEDLFDRVLLKYLKRQFSYTSVTNYSHVLDAIISYPNITERVIRKYFMDEKYMRYIGSNPYLSVKFLEECKTRFNVWVGVINCIDMQKNE